MSVYLYRAKWDEASRKAYYEDHPENFAGPDMSYPIKDGSDVLDAWKLAGKADDPDAVRKKIKSIAKRLGLKLPKSATTKKAAKRLMRSVAMGNVELRSMKAMHLFVPITRKEEKDGVLYVDGIAYGTAKVGDGFNLKSKTMKRMSDGYMKFGAIREMHQPSAAGTALDIAWEKDADGQDICRLSTKIVDEDAKKKVLEGVYKGFSVGVVPTVVRGQDVEEGRWIETSLVDRPWDEKALFTNIHRAEPYKDVDLNKSTFQVVVERAKAKETEYPGDITDPEQLQRAIDEYASEPNAEIRRIKMKKLRKAVGKIAKVKAALNGGSIYYAAQPTLTRRDGNMANGNGSGSGTIDWQQRALAAEVKVAELTRTVSDLEGKLKKNKKKLGRACLELEVLKRTPAAQRPVHYPDGGAGRSFAANNFDADQVPHFGVEGVRRGEDVETAALVKQYTELIRQDPTKMTPQQQKNAADTVSYLQTALADRGVDANEIQ